MSAMLAPVAALLAGLGLWRAAPARALPASLAVPLLGILGLGTWMQALALAGIGWTPLLLVTPGLASLALAWRLGLPPPVIRRPSLPLLLALAGSGPPVVLIATVPAFGWDFRYIWGLKARVFALAAGHAADWLAWPGHAFAHPGYPPLWPDLLAAGVILGGRVTAVAAVWQALLVAALAATCWWTADGARPWARALATLGGAWAPVIGGATHSGYAEPLLALGIAGGLGGLSRLGAPGAELVAACGLAVAAATKDEGTVLAIAAIAGALVGREHRGRPLLLLALLPVLAWRVWAAAVGIAPPERLSLPGKLMLERIHGLPASMAGMPTLTVFLELAIWVLILPWLSGTQNRPVRTALAGWVLATAIVYLLGPDDPGWRLATSLDRVLAAPLPAALAVVLGCGADTQLEGPGRSD